MQSIGGQRGIGAPLPNNSIGGENFIRHVGSDKLIVDLHEGSGATVYDKSHNGNNGTFGAGAAAPTWRRNSLYFDGGDYVDLTGISHGITTGGFTFCFSLNRYYGAAAWANILAQHSIAFFITRNNDQIKFYKAGEEVLSDTGISAIVPIIFQVTRDNSGNLECYINGKDSNKGESNTADLTYNGSSFISLGCASDFLNNFITATIYSFHILNRCLSGIECQQEYLANLFRGNN